MDLNEQMVERLEEQGYTVLPPGAGDSQQGPTLAYVRELLAEAHRAGKAVKCPACKQRVQTIHRPLNSGMAHALMQIYRHSGRSWAYLPSLTHLWRGRDEACLRYWGLIEEANEVRDDGGHAGYWRVTELGEKFVRGEVLLPKFVYTFNKNSRVDPEAEMVSIRDALGMAFNYEELIKPFESSQ